MVNDIKQLTSTMPEWFSLPVILITLFLLLWPKIQQVLKDLNSENRYFVREMRKHELLKLKYEIEALKKSHNLSEINEAVIPEEITEVADQALFSDDRDTYVKSKSQKAVWGGIAGLMSAILGPASPVAFVVAHFPEAFSIERATVLGTVLSALAIAFVVLVTAGATALVPIRNRWVRLTSFFVGMSVYSFIGVIFLGIFEF